MTDVFISYSRKDTAFVRQLHESLAAQNREIWVDWEDIPPTADWRAEIRAGIEAAESVIFVLSPDFVRSKECRVELELALENNKRLIPVMHRMITDQNDQPLMHEALNSHNWVYLRAEDDFGHGFTTLASALDTDLSYVREHTRLLVRAREWEARNRLTGFLLTRTEMKQAQDWLKQSEGKDPHPTDLHREYITASQRFLDRQRAFQIALVTALVFATLFAIVAIMGFQLANTNRLLAENNAATSVVSERLAVQNANTATVAQGDAQNKAVTAIAAQSTSVYNANNAATQAVNADNARATSDVNALVAIQNAVTATIAQGDAQNKAVTAIAAQSTSVYNANNAATQAVNADNARATSDVNALVAIQNAATATVAQGDAQNQAATAVVAERLAVQSAATATVALGDLQVQTQLSMSLGLAAQAQLELKGNAQERSVLLGLEAVNNYDYTWQAEQALGIAVQSSRIRRILAGTPDVPITNALYSPDGTRFITGSADGTATIWEAATGDAIQTFVGHTNWVSSARWSPDGFYVVTASDDMTAKIWEADTGKLIQTLEGGHTDAVVSAAFSPDGTKVATASYDGTAIIWDVATGQPLLPPIQAGQGSLHTVLWSPDGTRILTLGYDNTAVLWSARNGSFNSRFRGHLDELTSAAWSPDGSQLVTGSYDQTAIIWDVANTRALRVLSGHTAPVHTVAWSKDGSKIATGSGDGTMKLWDAELSTPPITLSVSVVYTLDLSPDATRVITTGLQDTAKVWELSPAGERFNIHPTEMVSSNVEWSPDGRLILGGIQQGTNIWNGMDGTLRYNPLRSRGGNVLRVAWVPDGDKVLVGKYTQLIEVWSVASPEEPILSIPFGTSGVNGSITSIAWSPDGSQFAATGDSDETTIWDLRSGTVLFTLPGQQNIITWSPDGSVILIGDENSLSFWDAETFEQLGDTISNYAVVDAAWSPDGSEILVGNADGRAIIYDIETFEYLLDVAGHIGAVNSVDWSPNGERFITASSDGTAKIWDAETGDDLLTLSDNTGALINADWSPDGDSVVTADLNGEIKVWNVWETLDDLVGFAEACCVARELTPKEREDFGLSMFPF